MPVLKLFVERYEAERIGGTSQRDFLQGAVVLAANLIGATIKFTIPKGEQSPRCPSSSTQSVSISADRLDKPAEAPIFQHGPAIASAGGSFMREMV